MWEKYQNNYIASYFFRHFFDIESYLIFSYKLNAIPAPARTTQSSFRKVWNQPNPLKVFLCLGGWLVAGGCAAGQGSVQQILTQDPSFIVLNNSEGVNISQYLQFKFHDILIDFILLKLLSTETSMIE